MLCISILAPVACYTAEVVLQPVPECTSQLFRCSSTTHADCCVHYWCHKCAQCQEMRELKARGGLQRGRKPSRAGPLYSNSGASSPTSPVDQKLQPLHMQVPVPAAAPPAHQHCPQVPSLSNCSVLLLLTEVLFYTRNKSTTRSILCSITMHDTDAYTCC
jgi:hypothetical protein